MKERTRTNLIEAQKLIDRLLGQTKLTASDFEALKEISSALLFEAVAGDYSNT